jgi:microcystin-dependent protein
MGESLQDVTPGIQVIGHNWGSEDKSNTFKLPDLRGLFLRGWNHASDRDPDTAGRVGNIRLTLQKIVEVQPPMPSAATNTTSCEAIVIPFLLE